MSRGHIRVYTIALLCLSSLGLSLSSSAKVDRFSRRFVHFAAAQSQSEATLIGKHRDGHLLNLLLSLLLSYALLCCA